MKFIYPQNWKLLLIPSKQMANVILADMNFHFSSYENVFLKKIFLLQMQESMNELKDHCWLSYNFWQSWCVTVTEKSITSIWWWCGAIKDTVLLFYIQFWLATSHQTLNCVVPSCSGAIEWFLQAASGVIR